MSRFYDPVPVIEKSMPGIAGVAASAGVHDGDIFVNWNAGRVVAKLKGDSVAIGDSVKVVGIENRIFALKAAGGYPSTQKKQLSSWKNKAPASAAIRQIMKDNPRRKKYQIEKVISYDAITATAELSSGDSLPVAFGVDPSPISRRVAVGELALVFNGPPRHVIGGLLVYGESFSRFQPGYNPDLTTFWTPSGLSISRSEFEFAPDDSLAAMLESNSGRVYGPFPTTYYPGSGDTGAWNVDIGTAIYPSGRYQPYMVSGVHWTFSHWSLYGVYVL